MNYTGRRLKKTWCDMSSEEREEYVNQDYVPRREELMHTIENRQFENIWGTNKSEKKLIYELYYLDGMSINEITYHISYSRRTVSTVLHQLRNNINSFCKTELQKNILKAHFVDKLNYTDISNKLGCDYYHVSKIILSYLYTIM